MLFILVGQFLPFNASFGDQMLQQLDDGASGPVRKDTVSNLTCPFFGTSEDIIYVSQLESLRIYKTTSIYKVLVLRLLSVNATAKLQNHQSGFGYLCFELNNVLVLISKENCRIVKAYVNFINVVLHLIIEGLRV